MNDERQPGASESWLRRKRWWLLGVLLALPVMVIIWIRLRDIQAQDKNIQTTVVLFIGVVAVFGWLLFFARLNRWWKLGLVTLAFGLMLIIPALVRLRGVSGDLVPILEWRWAGPKRSAAVAPTVNSSNAVVAGTDFPQFLGPARNGIQAGPKLATNWQSSPPLELWRRSVGAGWSGFAVSGALAITQEQHGSEERVVAYELGTGQIRWSHADQARYSTTLAGEGPRATPTITGQRVVTMGATGLLNCLDPTTGQRLWSVNIVQANESKVNEWGMSGSPLIWRDLVVVSAGGRKDRSLVAYRLGNGEFAWGGGTDSAAYSSPIVAQLGGSEHIIMFNANSVVSHDPATGTVRWKYPWPGTHPHVAAPVTCPGDRVLVSSGYGHGSEMLQVTNTGGTFSAAQLWKSRGLKAKFNNPIYLDGHIYGLDDGIMVCLNADTGQQQWKDGRYGHGQMLLVGDLLLVTAESGEIVLLRPSPKERVELARFSALRSKTWNPPAVAGEFLLIRNDQEAACYRLPLRKG